MPRYRVANIHMVLDAISVAKKAHKDQIRKVSGVPYFYHPVAVAILVVAFKRSKHLAELMCAAILHDTLEDTSLSFEEIARRFSPLVAKLVLEVSNDEEEIARLGKLEYQKKKLCGISSYGLILKLADRLDNISDNPTENMIRDTIELILHLKKNRKLTNTQKDICKEILDLCSAKKQSMTTPA